MEMKLDTLLFLRREAASDKVFGRNSIDLQAVVSLCDGCATSSENELGRGPTDVQLVLRVREKIELNIVQLIQGLHNAVHVGRRRPEAFVDIELTEMLE